LPRRTISIAAHKTRSCTRSTIRRSGFWRRAVARVEPFLLDPVVETGFKIAPADKAATAGSCFAQHIARSLRESGFNYYVAERPDDGMSESDAARRNFGVLLGAHRQRLHMPPASAAVPRGVRAPDASRDGLAARRRPVR
jgi:hypothetical protein